MGMYTELYLAVRLAKNTPDEVIKAIQRLVNASEITHIEDRRSFIASDDWPEHPFFKCSRAKFCMHTGSYYFDAQPMQKFFYDDIIESWFLTFVSNIKNYDQEWQHFIDWITPHLDREDGHIGHYRHENDELPTVLYLKNGSVEWLSLAKLAESI